MNSGLKSGLVLLVLGIICGTLLALVNSFTEPEILKNEEKEKNAVLSAFYDLDNYDLEVIENVDENGVETIFVLTQNDSIEAIIYQVSATGYNGPVTMLIAINKDYSVQGYKVITHKEDAGFGADIVENDFNVSSVIDLSEFDSVAGVTFTSKAIKECFNIISLRAGNDFGGGLDD